MERKGLQLGFFVAAIFVLVASLKEMLCSQPDDVEVLVLQDDGSHLQLSTLVCHEKMFPEGSGTSTPSLRTHEDLLCPAPTC